MVFPIGGPMARNHHHDIEHDERDAIVRRCLSLIELYGEMIQSLLTSDGCIAGAGCSHGRRSAVQLLRAPGVEHMACSTKSKQLSPDGEPSGALYRRARHCRGQRANAGSSGLALPVQRRNETDAAESR